MLRRRTEEASTGGGTRPKRLLKRGSVAAAPWTADEVAAHLLDRQGRIVNGLKRQTPWVGLDEDTLGSCYLHGAAIVARLAESGQRSDWTTPGQLESAQIAAFRNQAREHWRKANAQSREGERSTIPFDPDRHNPPVAPLDRLFEHPELHAITRDLLAEFVDEEHLKFWSLVLQDGLRYKEAGDRLGVDKARVMALTRAGKTAFDRYFTLRESGELCRLRGEDLVRMRAGVAGPAQAERARAHLESCYACALVHEVGTSAFERGILGAAPLGLLLRFAARAGEIAAVPATRLAETSAGTRAVAGGIAALTVAGSGVGVKVAQEAAKEPAPKRAAPARVVAAAVRAAPTMRAPALTPVPPPATAAAAAQRREERRATERRRRREAAATAATVEAAEFTPESLSAPAAAPEPAPTEPAPALESDPAIAEFGGP